MSKFVLTAQLKLQAPRNTRQVVQDIRRQLKGVQVPVEIKTADKARKQIKSVTDETKKATSAANALGRSFGLAIKRFAAFTVASRAVSLFTNSLANAVDEAIAFERELIKIEQVTGASQKALKGLTNTINQLSIGLGTSSKDLLGVARILSQAGVQAQDLDTALGALAKTTLAATFDDISQTAEGAVAILRQFDQGVGKLEAQLGSINAVAGQFAVESGDLIGAVRRFGGVFKSAGGSLEELLAVFTSVRATTRESAESISTGLRTIFTRIQRPATIQFLKQFGVELTDLDGKFVGPFEAARRLSEAFAGLEQGDVRFIRIAEELGGFRQIGKVIPLLQQFATAQEALKVAQEGQSSLTEDAATAQASLAVQITKVKEEFFALVRGITADTSFQFFARTALQLASALLKVADAIKPLIPLIGAFAAIKFTAGLSGFLGGAGAAVRGVAGKNLGGKITAFARGGFVPGTGNRDTVPAMLTPGEFVIKKSSAKKLGAATLQQMNENRFAGGGIIDRITKQGKGVGAIGLRFGSPDADGILDSTGTAVIGNASSPTGTVVGSLIKNKNLAGDSSGNKSLFSSRKKNAQGKTFGAEALELVKELAGFTTSKKVKVLGRTFPDPEKSDTPIEEQLKGFVTNDIQTSIGTAARLLGKAVKAPTQKKKAPQSIIDQIGIDSIAGKVLEGGISLLGGEPYDPKQAQSTNLAPFDFPKGIGGASGKISNLQVLAALATDAKKTIKTQTLNEIGSAKVGNSVAELINKSKRFQNLKKEEKTFKAKTANKGGSIGGSGDTVPALLTPGEFVINKSAAQSIGYGNLNSMNKTGVARFAKGGAVQMLNQGGTAGGGLGGAGGFAALTIGLGAVQQAIEKLGDDSLEASDATANTTIALREVARGLTQLVVTFLVFSKINSTIKEWTNATVQATKAEEESGKAAKDSAKAKAEAGGATASESESEATNKTVKEREKATAALQKEQKQQALVNKVRAGSEATNAKLQKTEEVLARVKAKSVAATTRLASSFNASEKEAAEAQRQFDSTNKALDKLTRQQAKLKVLAENRAATLTREAQALGAAKAETDKYIASTRAVALAYTKGKIEARALAAAQSKAGVSIFKRDILALAPPIKGAIAGFRQIGTELKKLAQQAKRGLAPGGALRKGLGKAASAFSKAAAVVQSIFIVAQTAARAFAGIFGREEEKAKAEGDINKANEALKGKILANALAERLSFTGIITGIVESLAGGESFAAGLKREFDKGSVQNAEAVTTATIQSQLTEAQRGGENRGAASVAAAGEIGTDLRDSLKAISSTSRLSDSERRTAVLKQEQLAVKAATELGKTANSAADLEGILGALKTGNEEFDEKVRQAAEAAFAAAQAQKAVTKANFDSLKITSAFNAANAAVSAFEQSLVTGAPALNGFLTTLEAAQNNIGIDASDAIAGIESELLASAGGNTGLSNAIKGQASVAKEVNRFSQSLQKGLNEGAISRNDPEKAKADLEAQLLKGIDLTSATGQQIRDVVRGRLGQINEKNVGEIDISEIVKDIQTQTGKLSQGFTDSAKALAAHNTKMDGLYKKRQELENKQVAAQNKFIDTQLEVAKILESVGGDRVTLEDKLDANSKKVSNILGTVGLAGTDTANALGEIGARSAQLNQAANISAQAVAAGGAVSGVFAGRRGREQDNREQLKKATDGLLAQTRERIKLYQEELQIVKQKNAAEQSALEKLVTGDIEGFLTGIETSGAQAALQTGDANLAGLFGASALGRAFKEGKDFLGPEAAGLALGAVGIKDTRAADILAGGGGAGEVESIQDAIRKEAGILEAGAALQAEFANAELTANQVIINSSDIAFNRGRSEAATGFARGGTVYANRGMFIPRGTDTVPAMLTPGEFVVNRAAVSRGNNLQILRAMNGQGVGNAPSAGSAAAMSRGGSVGYYQDGGQVAGGISMSVVEKLNNAFSTFEKSVNKLVTSKFQVSLDTAQVNVVFNGGSFLNSLTDQVRTELFKFVGSELQKGKFDNTGNLQSTDSVLGN